MTGPSSEVREERSRRYPAASVRDAIAYLEQIHVGVGMTAVSRETMVQALGHSSVNGASKAKLAVLRHFGLLDREGERYRISELGKRVVIPRSDAERDAATVDAVRQPALFQELGATFDQQRLPAMLANVIARDFGVTAQASAEVADVFTRSAEQAGLLIDGVLRWTGERDQAAGTDTSPERLERHQSTAQLSSERALSAADGTESYTIPLDSRGKKALIHIPVPTASKDLDRIAAWVSYMRSVVSDDAEPSTE
jgi:hypothetical protein